MGDGIKPVGDGPLVNAAPGTPATADPADVHAMRAAMSETPTAPSLSSLFSSQGAAAGDAVRAADRDAPDRDSRDREPTDEDVAAEVAERVLVTDRDYSDDEEVRIYLKNSVLVDTEVHLRRVASGLEVRVQTGDRGSYAILSGAKDSLARRLESCCDGQVRLDIVFMGSEE
ncbi:type III secretion HpaP family protein [Desulfocurvus sp. DL9XJH121]